MKLNVPDGFVEFVKGIGEHVSPSASVMIDVLKWASEKPDAALRVAEEAKKLNETGKREFEYDLFQLAYKPDEALKRAIEQQKRNSKNRSLLSKVIAHAKRGGFRLKLANGAGCEVRKHEDGYVFKFNPGGVEVQVYHSGRFLAETVKALTERSEFSCGLYAISGIILNGKMYRLQSNTGRSILKAIKENVNPYVYVVVNNG